MRSVVDYVQKEIKNAEHKKLKVVWALANAKKDLTDEVDLRTKVEVATKKASLDYDKFSWVLRQLEEKLDKVKNEEVFQGHLEREEANREVVQREVIEQFRESEIVNDYLKFSYNFIYMMLEKGIYMSAF